MLIVILALIVLVPVAFVAFVVNSHMENVTNIYLAQRQAERDQMAADARNQPHYI